MNVPAYTFQEFTTLCRKFGEGHFNLLIVVGSPGLSKSRTISSVCSDARIIQGGQLSAFDFYRQLYQYRNQTVVVDDIDSLYTNKDAVRLLKSVCQSETVKTVGWHTGSKQLPLDESYEPVTEFTTTSRVCIIANEWKSLNKNIHAVGDRGMLVTFEPSAHEVHRLVCEWFHDAEVLTYIAKHLDIIADPSMRQYIMAEQLKKAGMDWKNILLLNWNKPIPTPQAMQKLKKLDLPEREKVRLFEKWTGLCRATYFNQKKKA